jgi:hypothetical protein
MNVDTGRTGLEEQNERKNLDREIQSEYRKRRRDGDTTETRLKRLEDKFVILESMIEVLGSVEKRIDIIVDKLAALSNTPSSDGGQKARGSEFSFSH